VILNLLLTNTKEKLSIMDIARQTGITAKDIMVLLESYQILRQHEGKYFFYTEPEYLRAILKNSGREYRKVESKNIHWKPHFKSV